MKYFFFFSVLQKLYGEVAKELLRCEPGCEFSGIVYARDHLQDLRQCGFPSDQVAVFTEELSRRADCETDANLLSRWEQRHGVLLSAILSTDRRYGALERQEGLRVAATTIEVCESLLGRIQPDVVVAEGTDDILSHVLYYSARERNIPYLITYASPTPNRVAIYSNPDNHWERVEQVFAELKGRGLTVEQRERAAELIRVYREEHVLPSYLKAGFNRLFSGRELHSLWKILRKRFLEPARRFDATYGGLSDAVAHKIARTIRARVFRPGYFAWQESSEPFVFFPLQLEPECSTLVFAPFHANQRYVIECISKSLPVTHLLYVKEHPAMLGRRPLSFFRALRSLPNVRLISPAVGSHALIERASAVVTITSSVGWEALMHGKPVMVLGNVWFDACDLVYRVRATKDLPLALGHALCQHRPDEELLLRFAAASLEGTYPGAIEHPDYTPSVLSRENVTALADAITRHRQWLEETPSKQPGSKAAAASGLSDHESPVVTETSSAASPA